VLLIHALGSHGAAAADAPALAVAFDLVHLVAVAAWVGGLGHLLIALWALVRGSEASEGARVAARLVPRFSTIAIISVAALVLTGVYQSWLHVGSVAALLTTEYGRALLAKLVLVAPLVGFGAINLLVLRRRLDGAVHGGAQATVARRLGQTVAGEVGLALAVLAIVGILANAEPGRVAVLAQGIERTVAAEDLQASLRVQPGVAGANRFDAHLTDRRGDPIVDAEKVALRFTMATMDMGESELVAYHRGDGHYVAQGGPLIMEGSWRVEAVVRRAGREDARPAFDVPVASALAGTALGAPPVGEGRLLVGVELLVVGVGALAFALWVAPRRRSALPVAVPIGVVAIVAGSLIAGSGAAALSATVRNPIPPTRESVQQGREIYVDRCAVCHGAAGRGDGPAAITLQPRPADFRVHLAAGHTEAQLFDWLSNGFPGTTMPAFRNDLSTDERWHVLNFIQVSFGPGRPQPTAGPSTGGSVVMDIAIASGPSVR